MNITHAIIDKSVKVIDEEAFYYNFNLMSVETHDGLEKIMDSAFCGCRSLTHIDGPSRSLNVSEWPTQAYRRWIATTWK
jgi:hypothetical protein